MTRWIWAPVLVFTGIVGVGLLCPPAHALVEYPPSIGHAAGITILSGGIR